MKKTKMEVNYRSGRRENKCAMCKHFRKPSGCSLVSGHIDPGGLCDLYEYKE